MSETPDSSRNDRPITRLGRPFGKGNPGRVKGNRNRSTRVGIEIASAMSGQAAETLRALLSSRSARIRLEACRTILGYAWGLPKQTLELAGGVGNLAAELTKALAEARVRRAALEADRGVASLLALPLPILAPPGAEIPAPEAPVLGEVEPEPAAGEETP